MEEKNNIIIYQTKNGSIELKGDLNKETIWATRMQMAEMFGVNPQAISKHIKNIFKENELKKSATSSKMELVQNESGRIIKRNVDFYNLDVLISVGYRISSKTGTKFRQWATSILRSHIVQGYTLNKKRISQNYNNFVKAVDSIKKLLPKEGTMKSEDTLELVKMFALTWFSLDAYDKLELPRVGITKKQVKITAQELTENILELKKKLINKKEASRFFGQEKEVGVLEGIIGNIFQSVFGKNVYLTVEEKAAHLLYFIVKNHPFVDGNKRSGAFAFIWFLQKAKILNNKKLTPETLTALTILIAESNSKDKDKMIGLILLLLKK